MYGRILINKAWESKPIMKTEEEINKRITEIEDMSRFWNLKSININDPLALSEVIKFDTELDTLKWVLNQEKNV